MPAYLGGRYAGGRYFGVRYFGTGVSGGGTATGTFEVYDGTVVVLPLGPGVVARGSDNAVELRALHGQFGGLYPTTATVTCSLVDASGSAVSGATNIAMPHVTGTTDAQTVYRGEIPASITRTLTIRAHYTLTVTATDTDSNVRVFSQDCVALP